MTLEELTPELVEKAKACKTFEELAKLAEEAGVELSDEQVEAISGGSDWYCASVCPSKCSLKEQCIIDTGNPCLLNA